MKITSKTYGPLRWGIHAGQIAFHFTVDELDKEATAMSPAEIARLMHTTTKTSAHPLVRFTVLSPIDEAEMFNLLKTLRDWGFVVQTDTDGTAWHTWMGVAHYNIVTLTSPTWMGFAASEVHYCPREDESFSDPVLPAGKIEGTNFYLRVPTNYVQDAWNYMQRSTIPWAIIPTSALNFSAIGDDQEVTQ